MNLNLIELDSDTVATRASALADLLIRVVASGGAVGFMSPLAESEAHQFWNEDIACELLSGRRRLYVAERDGKLAGAVQLVITSRRNQPHHVEVAKMIVDPRLHRRGIGRRLIGHALDQARILGKSLVTLDTKTGDAAQSLYASFGFETAGVIPDFAWDPDGAAMHATTYMYLRLTEANPGA